MLAKIKDPTLIHVNFQALILHPILDRPVFTPDLPWKEKATQVNSVLDIHVSRSTEYSIAVNLQQNTSVVTEHKC